MRWNIEEVRDLKEALVCDKNRKPLTYTCCLELIDTIESQQQEIEQLKDENASLRNWNACEEKLHNELLESDKRRWELELELEDANNYRAGFEAIVDKLRAQVVRMSEILSAAHIFIHMNAKASDVNPDDLLLPKQIEEALEGAPDYHNPADITLLRKAKDCLKQGIKQLEKYINRFEQTPEEDACIEMHETVLEIDKILRGIDK